MGDESRLYVVEKGLNKSKSHANPTKLWADVIAEYNISKFEPILSVFKRETDSFFYSCYDGDTEILKDYSGKPLTEASISEVVAFLESLSDEEKNHRRVRPLLGLLKGFDESLWGDLVVLHYFY